MRHPSALSRASSCSLAALAVSVALPVMAEVGTSQPNLYDWMAAAPVVVVAVVRSDDEPRNEFEVLRVAGAGRSRPGRGC